MIQTIFEIKSNRQIAKNTFEMVLSGDTSALTAPGQFVNIALDGYFLRRPISVCDYNSSELVLIYKAVGKGTEKMSKMAAGETLDILVGLGNGFDTAKSGDAPVLLGGGAGVPPMYQLCKKLLGEGKKVMVILGFNGEDEVFYEEKFTALGAKVIVTTADGSHGTKGFVTDALKTLTYSYFYACGPEPMLKAIDACASASGQLSFEERMGCGFGACMGCTCETKYGNKRICKDGPVLEREEIIW